MTSEFSQRAADASERQQPQTWATEWLPALGFQQMIDWIKARWTGIICSLLGHKRIPLTQYQDGYFLWACERCGYRDWEFAPSFRRDAVTFDVGVAEVPLRWRKLGWSMSAQRAQYDVDSIIKCVTLLQRRRCRASPN
jgi:hypothetical protein